MTVDKDRFVEFLKRDMVYIIVCLVAILACLYTIESVQEFEDHCNMHWTEEIKSCNCGQGIVPNWSENYTLLLPLQEIGIVDGGDEHEKDKTN